LAVALFIAAVSPATGQSASTNAPTRTNDFPATSTNVLARIRDEGLNRSQITNALIQLTEVSGPRLTGSPNFKRSAEWARQQLEKWGLSDSHLESWGPFGRGWSLRRFSAQVVEPQAFPLTGFPPAWSPGLPDPITADVVYVEATTEAELEAYRGRLKGVIALVSSPRELRSRTEPDAYRLTDANLLQLANLDGGIAPFFAAGPRPDGAPSATNQIPRRGDVARSRNPTEARGTNSSSSTNMPSSTRTNAPGSRNNAIDRFAFAHREGAAAVITTSRRGDGHTLVVERASLPGAANRGTNGPNRAGSRFRGPWATNAPASPPQVQVQPQDYNRMVRMIRQGQKLRMELDLDVEFHDDDLMGYNVIAEIPGGDLREEVVMLGGHLDSWHSGTGATDNAAGVAVAMEAVRILQAVDARPRRTVRIALWGGEEQGLLGSTAYVRRHLGYYTNTTDSAGTNVARSPRDGRDSRSTGSSTSTNRSNRTAGQLIRQPEYEKFSAYFNLDNGTGKIRGVYLQGNEAVRPLFRKWLEPFRDLGAETLTSAGTSATDHMAFNDVDLPGFQFIQDPLDYWSQTHHSNLDVYDRLQIDELKQAATIMAAFVYQTAMLDEKLPRKASRNAGREGR
jgi:hypothetical protein